MTPGDIMAGWTTVGSRAEAERLARGLVEARLAACTQISGPITSFYRWNGALESAEEFRITVKYSAEKGEDVAKWLEQHHPYETPQWVACRVDQASEKYLKWVLEDRT
jgi:periplasmic divalent cation tolerance protein